MTDLEQKITLKMAWDYASPRRGSEALPLVYGEMSAGGQGGLWRAVCLDTESFVYALAGHGLLSSGNTVTLYDKDGDEIDSGDYTLNMSHDFEGKGVIASATFSADAKAKEPITVRAKGKADLTDALIENPVSVVRDFLVQVCGLAEDELDQTALSRAWSRAQALGYQAAGVVSRSASAASLVTEILGAFLGSWWRGADGKIKIFLDLGPGSTNENELTNTFSQAHLSRISISARLSELVNEVKALYCFNPSVGEFEAAFSEDEGRDLRSQGLHGVQAQELELKWVRHLSTAGTICSRLVGLLASPRRIITCEEDALVSIPLEKGDAALLSVDWLYDQDGRALKNQIVRVLGLEPQLDQGTIRFTLLDTGLYKTLAYLADGGRLADGSNQAGGERDRRNY